MRKKKWVLPFLEQEKEYLVEDMKGFEEERPLYIEIGMGMGDFITQSAALHPDIYYVGLEREETCVARAIKKARDLDLKNFKVLHDDAMDISELFDEESVSLIYLHFSDPWPKKRTHKRRLTYPTFLKSYEKILKKDGILVFKTDNQDFFADSLTYFETSAFELLDKDEDYYKEGEPMTAYQAKFHAEGKPICYAKYKVNKV